MKNHGYTNVLGVLTHMDHFPQNKSLSKLKRQIKKRFQKEATDKAKLFYIYGLLNNLYPKIQIHNLARYLRVIKPVEIPFRQNNPYLFCDKYLVQLNNSEEDESTVSFFGYIRGGHFNQNRMIYINGLGDYKVGLVKVVNDPCPYETVSVNGIIKRTLKQKENTLFAPWCKINNIEFDKKDGYITIPEKQITLTKRIGETNEEITEGVKLIRELQKGGDENAALPTFIDREELKTNIEEEIEEEDEVEEEDDNLEDLDDDEEDIEIFSGVKINKKPNDYHSLKNKRDEYGGKYDAPQNKFNDILKSFKKISSSSFLNNPLKDAERLEFEIYGDKEEKTNKEDSNDFLIKKKVILNKVGSISEVTKQQDKSKFSLKFLLKKSKRNFVTSDYIEDTPNNKKEIDLKAIEDDYENDSDSENKKSKFKKTKKIDEENEEEEKPENIKPEKEIDNKNLNDFYTEDYGFFQLGKFVRIDIHGLKNKVIEKFKSKKPLIICSVDIQEQATSFMKLKLEKHLYYPKILKSNDPIIYSIGWRRFQTTANLCVDDKHQRLRAIKYTPKFGSCMAISYGPIMQVYLRVVAFVSVNPKLPHFRVCATGDLLEFNQSFQVMKKLKLIGEPFKIEKKTAFIKGMFNSNMEVARYIGAEVKTVSGIRGQIKKQENPDGHALSKLKMSNINNTKQNSIKKEEEEEYEVAHASGREGCFRATFEDRILRSDIVYLKTWAAMPLTPFYNPILDYLSVKYMKTASELRIEKGILLQKNKDSEYKEIVRQERVFPKLMISNVSFLFSLLN